MKAVYKSGKTHQQNHFTSEWLAYVNGETVFWNILSVWVTRCKNMSVVNYPIFNHSGENESGKYAPKYMCKK